MRAAATKTTKAPPPEKVARSPLHLSPDPAELVLCGDEGQVPRVHTHKEGPWVWANGQHRTAALIEGPIAPGWWAKATPDGLVLTPPEGRDPRAVVAQARIMVPVPWPVTIDALGHALEVLQKMKQEREHAPAQELNPMPTDMITPTASARRELPPERYQISRAAVVNQVAYHVSLHNALQREAERSPKKSAKLLAEAERELSTAEHTITELEAIASDDDVDHVLQVLRTRYQWEPRDIRPVKMTRTPRQVRAGHTLGQLPASMNTAPPKSAAPSTERWKPYPEHPGTTVPPDYRDPSFDGVSDWSHYHVLTDRKQYRTVKLSFGSKVFAEARFGLQDGIPVMGYSWMDGKGGGGCAPGRKWGEFDTLEAAEIFAWEYMRGKLADRVKSGDHGRTERANIGHVVELIDHRLTTLQHQASSMATAPRKEAAAQDLANMITTFKDDMPRRNAALKGIGRTLKKKLGHQAGDVLPDGTMVVDPTNAILELHDQANAVVATPPATAPTPEQAAPYAQAHVVDIMERHKSATIGPTESWEAFDARTDALLSQAVAALDELYSNGYKSSARAIHTHVLEQFGEWLLTVFAPQAPTLEPAAPTTMMEREPGGQWKPVATRPAARNLAELAAPFGADRRERETIKRRFSTLYGKLTRLPKDQLAAFLQHIQQQTQ